MFALQMLFAAACCSAGLLPGSSDPPINKMCPVMTDEEVDPEITLVHQGKTVAFCCDRCVLGQVSGEAVDEKVSLDHNGSKVHFCSGKCQQKFKAEPGKYSAKLANAYTYQTQCPVMGETISPTSFIELPTGQTIYLCCDRCKQKFNGDLAKYAAKLRDQNIFLNVEAILKKGAGEKGSSGGS